MACHHGIVEFCDSKTKKQALSATAESVSHVGFYVRRPSWRNLPGGFDPAAFCSLIKDTLES